MRQGRNQSVIIGVIKEKDVNYYYNTDGTLSISIELTIESVFDGKIHTNRIRFFTKETTKLYKGYIKVANDYNVGDRVCIEGSIEMAEFVGRDGKLHTMNNLKGLYIKRLKQDADIKDEVGAVVEAVVLGYSDEIVNGQVTGRKKVQLFTVGYNKSISELQNVYVEASQAEQFTRLYKPNSTGELFIKVNNYVEEIEEQPVVGFGIALNNMMSKTKTVNELIIIGGEAPKLADNYTNEEITEMKKIRELSTQEKNKISAQPIQLTTEFEDPFAA